jgi:hypothetical protein
MGSIGIRWATHVTEAIVKLMVAAPGGEVASAAES